MKQYKQKEVSKLEGVSERTIQRWSEDDLYSRGWTKHELNGKPYYTREQDDEVDGVVTTRADLEIRKLKAEIADKEQKLDKRQKLQFQGWSIVNNEVYVESYAPYKDTCIECLRFKSSSFEGRLHELELNEEQIKNVLEMMGNEYDTIREQLNESYIECTENYLNHSENIYLREDIETL